MIELTDQGRGLVSAFFAYRNDIDIYTEDEDKDKEFYNVLFSRLVGDHLRINDVTPLGSKANVIKRCNEDIDDGRKKIFIVDGDIHLITNKNIIHKDLHVLDSYCIENFIIDETSVVDFCYRNDGTRPPEEIKEMVGFDAWLSSQSRDFIEIFLHFAILHDFGIPFTLNNAFSYFDHSKNSHKISKAKLTGEIKRLKAVIVAQTGEEDYLARLSELKTKWPVNNEVFLKIVSGKDYLIPLVQIRIGEVTGSKAFLKLEKIKISLVMACNLKRLHRLKEAILAL